MRAWPGRGGMAVNSATGLAAKISSLTGRYSHAAVVGSEGHADGAVLC